MDRAQKAAAVAELNRTFSEVGVVVVTRNLGMSVAQSTQLRAKMRDAGATYKVAKNRLAKLAIKDTAYTGLDELLVGPTGLAWSDDPVAAAKAAQAHNFVSNMPEGYDTILGERGVNLSGGQKQRINICRAIYVGADIQIFDDPISALDAPVGKHVFQNVFLGAAADKTRILVTHALHFLPQVDYIYTMVDGRVGEHGTYADLMAADGDFARFVN